METMWHYRHGATEAGPLTATELEALARGGRLTATDFIRQSDQATWNPAAVFPEFAGVFPASNRTPAFPPFVSPSPVQPSEPKPIWPWIAAAACVGIGLMTVFVIFAALQIAAERNTVAEAPQNFQDRSSAEAVTGGAILDISGVDATPELGVIISRMNDEQKLAIGLYNATTGLDFYAARVRISNGGDRPAFINPKNIRLHLDGETVGAVPMSDARFLQPLSLSPGRYVEGLVVYLAYPEAGAAMRLGAGSISYLPAN